MAVGMSAAGLLAMLLVHHPVLGLAVVGARIGLAAYRAYSGNGGRPKPKEGEMELKVSVGNNDNAYIVGPNQDDLQNRTEELLQNEKTILQRKEKGRDEFVEQLKAAQKQAMQKHTINGCSMKSLDRSVEAVDTAVNAIEDNSVQVEIMEPPMEPPNKRARRQ